MSENKPLLKPGEPVQKHPWTRYVALGDSFTEGIGDPEPRNPGGHRGWADRVAEELGRGQKDFAYANLAVRGRLLQQIIDQQVGPCLALQPDLVTLSAGGNDLIRPGGDPDALAEKLDAAVAEFSSGGATVVLFNGPDTASSVLGPDPQQGCHLQREPPHSRRPARRRDCGHVVLAAVRDRRCGMRTGCTSRRWATTPSPRWCWIR